MPIEIQTALIGLLGSTVGALIGSGVIGYLLNIKKEKSEADKKTYFFVKSMVTNNDMTHLKEADFYDGVPKKIVENVYDINYWSETPGYFKFHNKKLNQQMDKLLEAAKKFAEEVPNKTLPEGPRETQIITTMTERARSDHSLRERHRRESDELVGVAEAVYLAVNNLDNDAIKELRISPAEIQKIAAAEK
ncbi:hypothetical protein [Halomonas sp. SL1]|uniref:hypothetical protein n=1 Tax=Halomonas sp. SL1 TaxID=2137478 RepID=UPI0011B934E0|nr:hypothetical protein [Halomonas sp. SL1]